MALTTTGADRFSKTWASYYPRHSGQFRWRHVSYFEWSRTSTVFLDETDIPKTPPDIITSAFHQPSSSPPISESLCGWQPLMNGIDKVAQAHLQRGLNLEPALLQSHPCSPCFFMRDYALAAIAGIWLAMASLFCWCPLYGRALAGGDPNSRRSGLQWLSVVAGASYFSQPFHSVTTLWI